MGNLASPATWTWIATAVLFVETIIISWRNGLAVDEFNRRDIIRRVRQVLKEHFALNWKMLIAVIVAIAAIWLIEAFVVFRTGVGHFYWPWWGLSFSEAVQGWFIGPCSGEIVFRGFILLGVKAHLPKHRRLGSLLGIAVSTALFAMTHGPATVLRVDVAMGGVVLALVTLLTGSLTPAVLVHIAHNVIMSAWYG